MGIEPKVSHAQSKLGAIKPRYIALAWFERPYMYLINIYL